MWSRLKRAGSRACSLANRHPSNVVVATLVVAFATAAHHIAHLAAAHHPVIMPDSHTYLEIAGRPFAWEHIIYPKPLMTSVLERAAGAGRSGSCIDASLVVVRRLVAIGVDTRRDVEVATCPVAWCRGLLCVRPRASEARVHGGHAFGVARRLAPRDLDSLPARDGRATRRPATHLPSRRLDCTVHREHVGMDPDAGHELAPMPGLHIPRRRVRPSIDLGLASKADPPTQLRRASDSVLRTWSLVIPSDRRAAARSQPSEGMDRGVDGTVRLPARQQLHDPRHDRQGSTAPRASGTGFPGTPQLGLPASGQGAYSDFLSEPRYDATRNWIYSHGTREYLSWLSQHPIDRAEEVVQNTAGSYSHRRTSGHFYMPALAGVGTATADGCCARFAGQPENPIHNSLPDHLGSAVLVATDQEPLGGKRRSFGV